MKPEGPEVSADAGQRVVDSGSLPDAGQAPDDKGVSRADGGCVVLPVRSVPFTSGASGSTTWFLARAPAPRGLVLALHGTNGSATSVAQNKLEWQAVFGEALARNYSVLVPESEQRTSPRRWDNSPWPTNPDLVRLASLLDDAVASGALPAGGPILVIGMSQGGGVAPLYGQLLASRGYPVRAVAVHSAGPTAVVSNSAYTLPTTFTALQHDDIVPAADTLAAADALTARGVPTERFVKPASTVCPEAFTRIPGVDADGSRAIFAGLVDAGVLSAAGEVRLAGSDLDQSSALPGVPAPFSAFTRAIDEQVQVAGARHAFFGGRAAATFDFVEARR
ncbi:MAG: hypothetical protein SFW67_22075 [Myxococcaceae bacterium]|nr:hypothetical protein [Myxococcaceae bacterium]